PCDRVRRRGALECVECAGESLPAGSRSPARKNHSDNPPVRLAESAHATVVPGIPPCVVRHPSPATASAPLASFLENRPKNSPADPGQTPQPLCGILHSHRGCRLLYRRFVGRTTNLPALSFTHPNLRHRTWRGNAGPFGAQGKTLQRRTTA